MAPVDVDQDLAEAGGDRTRRAPERVGSDAHELFEREGPSESEVDGARRSCPGPGPTNSPSADLQPFALAGGHAHPFEIGEASDRPREFERSLDARGDPIQDFREAHAPSVREDGT